MGFIEIVTSGGARTKRVPVRPVLPGLVIHDTLGESDKDERTITFTHKKTGLAILIGVPEGHARAVRDILAEQRWNIPADEIYESAEHSSCLDRALNMVTLSRRREQEIAAELDGGKVQPGSGAVPHHKRDILTPSLLIEHKTTYPGSKNPGSFRLENADLEHAHKQARVRDLIPVYVVEFIGRNGAVFIPEMDTKGLTTSGHYEVIKEDASRKKSFLVTEKFGKSLDWDTVGLVTMQGRQGNTRNWVCLGYRLFLDLAKRVRSSDDHNSQWESD